MRRPITFKVERIIELQNKYAYPVFRQLLSDTPAALIGGEWYRIKIEGEKSLLDSVKCNPDGEKRPF